MCAVLTENLRHEHAVGICKDSYKVSKIFDAYIFFQDLKPTGEWEKLFLEFMPID